MKTITQINSSQAVEIDKNVTGTRAQLHHEPSPGLFVHVSLTPELLAFTCGDQQVAFTIAGLLDHVRTLQPSFAQPSTPQISTAGKK